MNPESVRSFVGSLGEALAANDGAVAEKQVEQSNVERLRSLYVSLLDQTDLTHLFSDDVELEIAGPRSLPMAGRWRGRADVLSAAARNFGMLEDQRPEVLSLVAQGDDVAVVAREKGRLKGTGREYEIRWLQLFTFRDGRIARVLQFCDDPTALTEG